MLDIVMYHYVRPLLGSRYPNIKGLEIDGFKRQLEFFASNRTVISTTDVINAIKGKFKLPKGAVWLTFDDGYKDHIEYVAPLLEEYGFDGAFFPVSDCYAKNQILDVNKIHYILASVESDETLVNSLKNEMFSLGYSRSDWNNFWLSIDKSSRFDSENTIFFKRMLQRDLPLNQRQKILTNLFKKIVGRSEYEVAKELYMSESDLISLHKKGFTIGSHTSSHRWLNTLSKKEQISEIRTSLTALKKVRGEVNDWIMCFPYGEYNKDTLSILKANNCALALTTNVGTANLLSQKKYELSRFDTNDFPQ